jgi:hypothetical protein
MGGTRNALITLAGKLEGCAHMEDLAIDKRKTKQFFGI